MKVIKILGLQLSSYFDNLVFYQIFQRSIEQFNKTKVCFFMGFVETHAKHSVLSRAAATEYFGHRVFYRILQ